MNNIDNPADKLKLASISIPFFTILFLILPMWLMFSSSEPMVLIYKYSVFFSILIGILYCIAGLFIKPSDRIFSSSIINALAIWPYAIIPFGFLSFGYLIFVQHNRVFLISATGLILISAAAWVLIKITAFKRLFVKDSLIEKNLIISESHISFKRGFSVDFEPPVISTDSAISKFLVKKNGKILTIASFIVSAGYAISQILNKIGTTDITILLISLLSFGLTLHIWGKMACSTYFHFFVIRSLEKKYKKPLIGRL
ncbi:hypothetical protein [Chromobacterium sp. IIBBL 290-4]|uniref:hypothetical protein n=1 Tax=Chromobacterium sp. IIBBL 290-4 TaxID=2953890 RepID=UPI0020B8A034|nr:hypothetical protein [Chromobacterium sp. IIBBL 290-4]UTH73758.1 hypothetical protein NKT35_19775 [Chromobacterium sp. IIBBL 290-4]